MINTRDGVFVYIEDNDKLIVGEKTKYHLDLLRDNTDLVRVGKYGEVLETDFKKYSFGHIKDNIAYVDPEISNDCDLEKVRKKLLSLHKFKKVVIL